MQNDTRNKQQEKPRLRLPFEKRKVDFGTWTYTRRAGISAIVVAFLLFGIVLVSWKIKISDKAIQSTITMEFEQEMADLEELRREEVQDALSPADYSDIVNRISNENAELNSQLRDAQGHNACELYGEADRLEDQMRANREAYESGLRVQQDRLNSRDGNASRENSDKDRQDAQVRGNVAVSFSFKDPVRTSDRLVVPAYMCEGEGQVVVNATLDNNGFVTSAAVDSSRSSLDECMRQTALGAARSSRFNLDNSAPAKHKGTITYLFRRQ